MPSGEEPLDLIGVLRVEVDEESARRAGEDTAKITEEASTRVTRRIRTTRANDPRADYVRELVDRVASRAVSRVPTGGLGSVLRGAGRGGSPPGVRNLYRVMRASNRALRRLSRGRKVLGAARGGGVASRAAVAGRLAMTNPVVLGLGIAAGVAIGAFKIGQAIYRGASEQLSRTLRDAEYSGALTAVQNRENLNQIRLAQIRGNALAPSAAFLQRQKATTDAFKTVFEVGLGTAKNYAYGTGLALLNGALMSINPYLTILASRLMSLGDTNNAAFDRLVTAAVNEGRSTSVPFPPSRRAP